MLLRRRIPERMREAVMMGIGLATLLIGFQMALQTRNVLGVIVSLAACGALGELLRIEDSLETLGRWAERRAGAAGEGAIAQAFVTSSLLFSVGPMTLLGAIQDGLGQPPVLLYTESLLDGASAVAIGAVARRRSAYPGAVRTGVAGRIVEEQSSGPGGGRRTCPQSVIL